MSTETPTAAAEPTTTTDTTTNDATTIEAAAMEGVTAAGEGEGEGEGEAMQDPEAPLPLPPPPPPPKRRPPLRRRRRCRRRRRGPSTSPSGSDAREASEAPTTSDEEVEYRPPGCDADGGGVQKKTGRPRRAAAAASHDPINPFLVDYTAHELDYYRTLPLDRKREVIAMEETVAKANDTKTPMRFRILLSDLDPRIKAIAMKKLETLDAERSDYAKAMQWMQAVCELPVGHYKQLPVGPASPVPEIQQFILDVRTRLDRVVYGHADAKEQIIRLLAQWVSNPRAGGMVLGIHGPPGIGKTSLIKEGICQALGLPFAFLPLGGASDSSYLDGHSYTYEGATWGKIVDVLMRCKCMNPVLYFDELDKVSNTQRGDEIINVLIHLTDSTQNDRFHDKYFSDFEFDLSKSLLIFSYNDEHAISPVLRDRMIRIHTSGYGDADKRAIARAHLFPDILREYGFGEDQVLLGGGGGGGDGGGGSSGGDDVLTQVIAATEEEKGVRNLKRALQTIVSHLNLARILDPDWVRTKVPYRISGDDVRAYVRGKRGGGGSGVPPYMYT
jgi:hypothetical protein